MPTALSGTCSHTITNLTTHTQSQNSREEVRDETLCVARGDVVEVLLMQTIETEVVAGLNLLWQRD